MNTKLVETLSRFDASQGPRKVGPNEGHYAELGGCGARFGQLRQRFRAVAV